MATPITLLKDFANGQGGGLASYANYPTDHDTNYTAIESTVNQLINELNSARLADSNIPTDILLRTGQTEGRFDPSDARITFVSGGSASVTVGAGKFYGAGRRFVTAGTTFDKAALDALVTGTQTVYVNTDANGLLSISTTAAAQVFDLAQFSYTDPAGTIASFVDNLDTSEALNGADMVNRIHEKRDPSGGLVGAAFPSVRLRDIDGNEEDAGFFHRGIASNFGWASQKDGGEGTGNPVGAAIFHQLGQQLLLEQARVFAVRTSNQSIPTGASFTAISFDAPVANSAGIAQRREPEAYFTNPFQSAAGATLTIPANSGLAGTYLFTAVVNFQSATTAGYVDVQLVQTVGGSAVMARQRVAVSPTGDTLISLAGMYDFVASDAWQLQVRHGDAGSINVQFARFTAMLIGGGV